MSWRIVEAAGLDVEWETHYAGRAGVGEVWRNAAAGVARLDFEKQSRTQGPGHYADR